MQINTKNTTYHSIELVYINVGPTSVASRNGKIREAGNFWAHKTHNEDKENKTHTHNTTQHRKLKR